MVAIYIYAAAIFIAGIGSAVQTSLTLSNRLPNEVVLHSYSPYHPRYAPPQIPNPPIIEFASNSPMPVSGTANIPQIDINAPHRLPNAPITPPKGPIFESHPNPPLMGSVPTPILEQVLPPRQPFQSLPSIHPNLPFQPNLNGVSIPNMPPKPSPFGIPSSVSNAPHMETYGTPESLPSLTEMNPPSVPKPVFLTPSKVVPPSSSTSTTSSTTSSPVTDADVAVHAAEGEVANMAPVDFKDVLKHPAEHKHNTINLALSQQAQILLALFLSIFMGCTIMRCCCGRKRNGQEPYISGRRGNVASVSHDMEWSDHTDDRAEQDSDDHTNDEEEEDYVDDEEDDVEQQRRGAVDIEMAQRCKTIYDSMPMPSKRSLEVVKSVSSELGVTQGMHPLAQPQETYDDEYDDEEDHEVEQQAVDVDEDGYHNNDNSETDDETRAIMDEFRDTDDDGYVE